MAEQSVVSRRRNLMPGGGASWALILLAVACLPVAYLADSVLSRVAGLAAAATITATALLLSLGHIRRVRADEAVMRSAIAVSSGDPVPVFCTDSHGAILFQNPAATDRFGPRVGQPMSRALAGLVPNASAVAFRQETALMRDKSARETIVTRRGTVQVTAFRVGAGTLWRLEEVVDQAHRHPGGTSLPMMVVSRSDTILSMNEAMRATLGNRKKPFRMCSRPCQSRRGSAFAFVGKRNG